MKTAAASPAQHPIPQRKLKPDEPAGAPIFLGEVPHVAQQCALCSLHSVAFQFRVLQETSVQYDFVGFAAFPHPLPSPADAGEGELVVSRYKDWRLNPTYIKIVAAPDYFNELPSMRG